ncbi:MAG: DUF488 domain-containing protein [Candidatus Hecatellales archaeon]|nr:MAG: DUF488 domain-containing protein [Candidatus Hecatellales archaeon]
MRGKRRVQSIFEGEDKPTIYTVGHSTRSLEEFIRILQAFGVEVAIDVRRFPGSRKYPHFSRETLASKIEGEGIRYVWLGDLLGGYREGGYQAYMETEAFKKGLEKLVKLAENRRVAVFCSEALWFRCHRRFLADKLVEKGFQVVHIYDEKRWSLHKPRKRRKR